MRHACLALAAAALLLPGCGGSSGGADSATSSSSVPVGTTSAAFGLDARPVNRTCVAPARPVSAAVPVSLVRVFGTAFRTPLAITQIPGDATRFFVMQRSGTVVSFPASNPEQRTTVLTVPVTVNTAGEGGLLGMAFHPQFASNGWVYISFTTDGGSTGMRSVIARLTSTDRGNTFGGYKVILGPFEQPFTNHKGGDLHFGADGYLYASFGDGGSAGDPLAHGQDRNLFFSKILRLDVDHGDPYAIPADNPFRNGGGEPATYAYGFRNPFRFSFDRATGEMWVGDVGQGAWEEIDARVARGGNYGWNTREGRHCYRPATGCSTAGLIDPVYDYDHNTGGSITGGVVYRGRAIPSLQGAYVFGDYVSQKVWTLRFDGSTGAAVVTQVNPSGPSGGFVQFGEDTDGEVYAVDISGPIYKLVPPSGTVAASSFPEKLSLTGCTDPTDARRPASGLIPFAPQSQLWSDGADKSRWMGLPESGRITIRPDGDFDLPVGSVLMKTFRVGAQPIETRLLVRHDDGDWAGYTYEWDADGRDATLLPASKAKTVAGLDWYYPSRSDCLTCHTGAAGRSLGLEIGQINGDLTYDSTGRIANQLATLDHIGVFDAPLPGSPQTLASFPAPTGTFGTAETRARAYLHANCAFCHRPDSVGGGNMDLRFATSLRDTHVCNATPSAGDAGVAGARIVIPGDPAHSLLSVRPKLLGAGRMPPLASRVVDPSGTAAIDAWIQSLTACP